MIIGFDAIKNMLPFSRSRIKIELNPPEPKSVEVLIRVEKVLNLLRGGWINNVLCRIYHFLYSISR